MYFPTQKNKHNTAFGEPVVGHWFGRGARCSSVVRAFAHGAMGCRIDPS